MFAGELAAGAGAFERGPRQVHLRLVGLAAAALALAPHRIVRGPQRGPLGRRQQTFGCLAAGLVGRQRGQISVEVVIMIGQRDLPQDQGVMGEWQGRGRLIRRCPGPLSSGSEDHLRGHPQGLLRPG